MSGVNLRPLEFKDEIDRSSLRVLNDFAIELISIVDELDLAWYVAREVVGKLGFADCVIYFVDHDQALLCQVAAIGHKNPKENEISNLLKVPVGSGITGHVANTREAIIVDDLINDSRYVPDLKLARSEICVPLISDGKVLGVIDCEDSRAGYFGQRHLELLTTVSAMASSKLALLNKDKVLRKNERNYRAIVEDQTEMISRHSTDGKRTFVNDSYCRFHGKTPDHLLGKSAYEEMPADDLKRLMALYKTLTPENPTGTFEVSFLGPDGNTAWQRWTKRAIFDENLQVQEYQAVGHDITESKQAEIGRLNALEEAEAANRTKSQFLAAMSHELRTPLNAILGFSDVMSNEYLGSLGNPKYVEYARDIRSSGEYLLSLVNDLLDISRIEAGQMPLAMEDISISQLIDESLNLVKEKAINNGISLVIKTPEDMPLICADRRALFQIILNLLSNALKYTPEGGTITAAASVLEEKMIIIISDTGVGIPADRQHDLTNPFSRAEVDPHKTSEGWGLGLAITKSLIDLHDGTLTIKSTVGKGTAVEVTLPVRSN